MARRFAKVSEEEIEEAYFFHDLVNTKTTIPLRVGEERWIYTSTLRYIAISKNVVGENDECQLSNGECTTERKCGY